jgi:hypothetical protein
MSDDPIVDEVHRTRARLLAECGGDLDRLMDRLQQRESEDRGRLVKSAEELKAIGRPPFPGRGMSQAGP